MQINVQLKGIDEAVKRIKSLSTLAGSQAMAMALNKTAAKGKTEVNRAITQRYAIKASEVSNSVSVRSASAKQGAKLQASISIFGSPKKQGRSLNLIHFTERMVTLAQGRKRTKDGTQNQLRFKIIKGAGSKTILGDPALKNGAFIGNKGRTVFQRVGKARLPIKPVQVIGVGQMFNFRPITERVIKRINDEFLTEVDRAIAQKLRQAA